MYTEEQLLQAIKYACEYQKAYDYQTAGGILIKDNFTTQEDVIKLLDELSNDTLANSEIDLKDIFDQI